MGKHMNWLLTVKASVDLEALAEKLSAVGATLRDEYEPIPLDDELVLHVEGPTDLTERLPQNGSVVRLNPDSDLQLYG